jgi:hypothetical protein
MKTHKVQIELPLAVYTELQQMANACGWKFEDVVLQTIKMGMPPTLGKVPNAFHSELMALNKLDDKALMKVAAGEGETTPTDDLHRKADFVALRRTYAMSLLRWRGHPLMGLEMM